MRTIAIYIIFQRILSNCKKGVDMRILKYFALLTIFIPMFAGIGSAEQDNDELCTAENVWNGTWECPIHLFLIEQNSSVITGRYDSKNSDMYDTGVLEGTLSGDGMTYSGKWTELGSFNYTFSDDNMSYTGTAMTSPQHIRRVDYIHPGNVTDATRVGEITDPDNLWTGDWTSARKTHHYIQNGSVVSGTNQVLPSVNDQPGILNGTVSEDGRMITGTWIETGYINYTVSDNGSYFNGTFSVSLAPGSEAKFMTAKKD